MLHIESKTPPLVDRRLHALLRPINDTHPPTTSCMKEFFL